MDRYKIIKVFKGKYIVTESFIQGALAMYKILKDTEKELRKIKNKQNN